MNMIVNSSDLVGYEAETKKETKKAVSKAQALRNLLKVWEGKQLKASKKVAGLSFLAVSLAACNSNDDTPYGEADITAAKAEGVASVDITSDNAAAVTAALTGADGTVYTDVAAAVAAGAASVDITSNDADVIAPVQASLDTLQASYDALVTSNTALQTQYDALVAPIALALTASATADTLIGGSGSDTFTGTTANMVAGDSIIDQSTTDSDTFTVTATGDLAAMTVTNVENIIVNGNALGTTNVDAANFSGVTSLSITRGDVTIAGATVTGGKTVQVSNLSSDGVGSVTVGAGTGAFTQTAAATDIAGYTLNLDNITGASAVNVEGASTLSTATTGTITYGDANNDTKAETDKPITINAANAGSFVTHTDYDGLITINGGSETGGTAMDINNASGGIAITSASSAAGDKTYAVDNLDLTGGTITLGTGFTTTALGGTMTVNLDGTSANTDTVTLSAAGTVAVDVETTNGDQVDSLVLGGNGAAVTYNFAATSNPGTTETTSFVKTGDQSVTIAGDFDRFNGQTVTNIDVIDITAVTTAAAIGGTLWTGVGSIDLGIDNANNTITLNSGSSVTLTADQTTGLDINFVSGGDLTLTAGDDNGASAAVGTIDVPTLAPTAAATATGTVTIEASIANMNMSTATTLGALQTLVITGDEDVTLGTLTALGVDASGSSGIIDLTATSGVGSGGITTGSGADVIVLNDAATVHTVVSNAGNDTITATATAAGSSIDGGAGNDTINADDISVVVYAGGAGNDTFAHTVDLTGTIVGGEGTDTITIDGVSTPVYDATTFAVSGIEIWNITAANGAVTITDTNLGTNPTFAITGTADDTFVISSTSTATAPKTIDGSGLSLSSGSTAAVQYSGGAGNDTITGSSVAETFVNSLGTDTIEGGSTGLDTFSIPNDGNGSSATPTGSGAAATGMVVNLGSTAVSAATVTGATTKFAANSITSIGAGEVVYLYDAAAATNSSVIAATLSGVENVTSVDGSGVEYIVGSVDANVIVAGAGADHIWAGAGADTVTGGNGIDTIDLGASDASIDSVVYSGIVAAANANNVTSFEAGAGGDKVQFSDATLNLVAGAYTAGTAVTFANVAGITDTANQVIVDTINNLGALGVTIGNQSGKTNIKHQIAIASDTGAIFYDADGNWGAASVQIGDLDVTTGLTVANVEIIA